MEKQPTLYHGSEQTVNEPAYLVGKSGIEVVIELLIGRSREYWIGCCSSGNSVSGRMYLLSFVSAELIL